MKLRQHLSGRAFEIAALELASGQCPAIEYLGNLETKSPDTYASMLRKIEHRADNIMMRSSKPLRGNRYHGLYRLEQDAERLCYMYLPGSTRAIVLLNGYCKTDAEKAEWERARQYRIDLLEQL